MTDTLRLTAGDEDESPYSIKLDNGVALIMVGEPEFGETEVAHIAADDDELSIRVWDNEGVQAAHITIDSAGTVSVSTVF